MPEAIRFHFDEHIDPAIARAVRRAGIDITTSREAGLLGATDEEQLAFARIDQRVIVTNDDDFLKIASTTFDHPGIAFVNRQSRSIGQIIEGLLLIREALSPDEMIGHIEYI